MPNRYKSFREETPLHEQHANISVQRIPIPDHSSGLVDQMGAYLVFVARVLPKVIGQRYDIVFATSSRLMTGFLGVLIGKLVGAPVYLDIRDLFVDTIDSVFSGARARIAVPFFRLVERYAFTRAARLNVVSPGFTEHVQSVAPTTGIAQFSNGIDDEFLGVSYEKQPGDRLTVLYAGNLGASQALETVIPAAARQLLGTHHFRIIGDGARRGTLLTACDGIPNVEILNPVARAELVQAYQAADVLMLHLDDVPAFEKVLPSKLFEYGATGKPIVAGVRGYAASFIRDQLVNAEIFSPRSPDDLTRALSRIDPTSAPRTDFCERYRRSAIMHRMMQDVVGTMPTET